VLAGFAPAALKDATLYQMVDLLAPLKKRPYSFPFTVPSWSHTGA
jgi:phenylalanyl-tRNA synthetase alpha subunit